jgi:hypothetical protein
LVMDSYTTSTHQELAGTFLNYLVEVIMTTLNFTALLRYYKYKNWLMFCFIGIKRPLCFFCVFFFW